MSEPWFDDRTAGLVGGIAGSLAGLWGATFGCLAGWLVPQCRGQALLRGLLGVGLATGLILAGVGVWALVRDQPYHVWYPFLLLGVLLTGLSGGGLATIHKAYRAAEEQRMARQNAV